MFAKALMKDLLTLRGGSIVFFTFGRHPAATSSTFNNTKRPKWGSIEEVQWRVHLIMFNGTQSKGPLLRDRVLIIRDGVSHWVLYGQGCRGQNSNNNF